MSDKDLRERTKQFALKIIRLVASLPRTREADIIGRQLLKAGTSVGANYREANRARSKAEFRAKIGIVEQESDASLYWLEILKEYGIALGNLLEELLMEADELVAIFLQQSVRSPNKYSAFRIPTSAFLLGETY
jgi:four helix bundle protein